jgi:rare lipoprotein A (peptidoglycan hydrolase)
MHQDGNRLARIKNGLTALAIAALCAAVLVPVAQAGTGGASPASPPTASTSDGELVFSALRVGEASWYGPGLYGNKTACGQTLRANTLGVAHKRLPCGTNVKFVYHGHTLITQVIDRGPYIKGRAWDLTAAASEALEFEAVGVANLHYAIAREYARPGTSG